ncbi:MAG: hypothetical protein R3F11_08600 [Verrucomicrobiales bacterium]
MRACAPILAAAILASISQPAAAIGPADPQQGVEPGRAIPYYQDPATKLVLPGSLGALPLTDLHRFDDKRFGISLRYGFDGAVWADVYVYPVPAEDEGKGAAETADNAARQAIDEMNQMAERGEYADVEAGEITETTAKTSAGDIPLIEREVSFKMKVRGIKRPIQSILAVANYRGALVKIRASYEANRAGEEGPQLLADAMDGFRLALIDEDWRKNLQPKLETYFADPLSEDGRRAGGAIVTYAEESSVARIHIGDRFTSWLDDLPKDSVERADLLRAQIAGNIAKQVRTGDFQSQEKAAVRQLAKVYEMIQKEKPDFRSEGVEALIGHLRGGTLEDYLMEEID